jgi:hypothetical protein
MAKYPPSGAKKQTLVIEVTVKPADGNDSEFWDLGATPFLVAAQVAEQMLGAEKHGHKITKVVAHECTLKSVRG